MEQQEPEGGPIQLSGRSASTVRVSLAVNVGAIASVHAEGRRKPDAAYRAEATTRLREMQRQIQAELMGGDLELKELEMGLIGAFALGGIDLAIQGLTLWRTAQKVPPRSRILLLRGKERLDALLEAAGDSPRLKGLATILALALTASQLIGSFL